MAGSGGDGSSSVCFLPLIITAAAPHNLSRVPARSLASSRNALMFSEDCSLILFIFYNQRLHGAGKVHPHRQLRHKRYPAAATLPRHQLLTLSPPLDISRPFPDFEFP